MNGTPAVCVDCGRPFRLHRVAHCYACGIKRTAERRKEIGAQRALGRVRYAIQRGKLPRPDTLVCADCGGQARCYDHRDYSMPLKVAPVCSKCNVKRGPGLPVLREQGAAPAVEPA